MSSFKRSLVAVSAALVMSIVTVGATVGPAEAGSLHFISSTNA